MVLAQRPVTTGCQVMMVGVTMTMTTGRNLFPERKAMGLDPSLLSSSVYPSTCLRCSAIISLIGTSPGPLSLHCFSFGQLGRCLIYLFFLSQQLYVHMHAYTSTIWSTYISPGVSYPDSCIYLHGLSLRLRPRPYTAKSSVQVTIWRHKGRHCRHQYLL